MAKNILNIFLVDDDPMHLKMLEDHLNQNFNATIHTFNTGEACIENMGIRPEIIILDYYLNSRDKSAKNGMEILRQIKQIDPDVEVVMLSSQDRIEVAVDTMKYGAYDYVVKNESGFVRTEHLIEKIGKFLWMKSGLKKSKKLSSVLIVVTLLIIIISFFIHYYFPEWFPQPSESVDIMHK